MSIRGIKERSERYNFQISQAPGSSSINNTTRETENRRWHDPRLCFLFIEETAIVGLEGSREELTGWLLSGASERTCIAVVGMGGIGKTTIAKLVFDSQKVTTQFDCRTCITVSQSSTVRGLLINMMEEFCGETENPLMQMLHKMDDKSLITQVRKYLQHKKYLIFTTRIMQVADFFKKSFLVHVHNLQLLSPNKAWELFCKKAFRFEHDGHCPPELKSLSKEIVRKCKQLPLACSYCYDDLPYYLKPCILYFSIYPEDYCINHKRLIQQWIAEGFVKSDGRRTFEQVAEEYLSELIHRSLVLVSIVGFEGKVKTCQVHDLLREVIIGKMEDLSFCHFVGEVDKSPPFGITRRLSISISSNNVFKGTNNSHFRAIHGFGKGGPVEPFISKLCSKSRILKVLDMQETLDLRETLVHEIISEIKKLTKLQNLLAYHSLIQTTGKITRLLSMFLLYLFVTGMAQTYTIMTFTLFIHPSRSHKPIENGLVSSKLQNMKKFGFFMIKLKVAEWLWLFFFIFVICGVL
ncbi:unnamed protein product [Trifolium pratense]|uniref:Uncharacterized protein n=1 Tax=Trifolium pratense TaxID=57577 RepID=A0ACB0J4L7_TRIPR|nr:unnamed protein product [Trifolium pratense]